MVEETVYPAFTGQEQSFGQCGGPAVVDGVQHLQVAAGVGYSSVHPSFRRTAQEMVRECGLEQGLVARDEEMVAVARRQQPRMQPPQRAVTLMNVGNRP